MDGINQVVLVGRVMGKPASTQTHTGSTVTTLLLGTKNRDNSQTHRCILFGKAAEFTADHVKVGNWVSIMGRLDYRTYIKDNEERVSAEIYVAQFQLLPNNEVPAEAHRERLGGNQL